jgi:6-phosphogluconolactonase
MHELNICHDLFLVTAEKLIETGNEAIKQHGRFTLALAGGTTPKSLYQLLASDQFRDQIDWTKVHFFFGDERNVLPDSDESNFKMANDSLFVPLEINESQVFRWKTEYELPKKIAEDYNETLINFFGETPKFDLILLGMGTDGHTASLFPNTEALLITDDFAHENWVENLKTWRFTFTYPTINNAKKVFFIVSGNEKSEMLRIVLSGDRQPNLYPSQGVNPQNGTVSWMIDQNVAKLLT